GHDLAGRLAVDPGALGAVPYHPHLPVDRGRGRGHHQRRRDPANRAAGRRGRRPRSAPKEDLMTTETEVLDLVERWAKAEQGNDAEALAGLLADDFAGVGPLGFVLDRQQ